MPRTRHMESRLGFGRAKIISHPRYIESAWLEQYEGLAKRFACLLRSNIGDLVEIGCGRGQLTIPLSRLVASDRITLVDRFTGPYSKDHRRLKSTLAREKLRKVSVVVSDCARWLSRQPRGRYDALISNEFLCEIDSAEMGSFLSECYRVLKPKGITIHGFLSPHARNFCQRLTIEADSNPRWTKFPPKEWFSPEPESVAYQLGRTGFRRVRTLKIRTNLRIKASAARKLLKRWGVKETFWKLHEEQLKREGLEIPDWILVTGLKPP